MTNYRGYTIDGSIFNSKADIDKFVENTAVNAFKTACEIFNKSMSFEASLLADSKAEYLVKEFGYTWEQIEAIELSV